MCITLSTKYHKISTAYYETDVLSSFFSFLSIALAYIGVVWDGGVMLDPELMVFLVPSFDNPDNVFSVKCLFLF